MYTKIESFILNNWQNTVKPARGGSDTHLAIPYPYSVPCVDDTFTEMFYWDTYFTNVGLILSDMTAQAKNNVDNMVHFLNTYGMIPNASVKRSLTRSQPPFFALMAREVFDATGDTAWLENRIYPALVKEYGFWQTKRLAPNGLNFYSSNVTDEGLLTEYGDTFAKRFGVQPSDDRETTLERGRSILALFECGWDCSSRFGYEAHHINPVCLCSLLYMMERNGAYFADVLGKTEEAAQWRSRAEARREKMNALLWNEDRGVFCDRNYVSGKQADIVSAATFYPLFANLATEAQAEKIARALPLLETEYGIAASEERADLLHLQWDYPHGWACLHYIAVRGLLNYGMTEDALRIADKYVRTVARCFAETGNLWEKYNLVTGKVSSTTEAQSHTPTMMGWSAGVFLYCLNLLKENGKV